MRQRVKRIRFAASPILRNREKMLKKIPRNVRPVMLSSAIEGSAEASFRCSCPRTLLTKWPASVVKRKIYIQTRRVEIMAGSI